MKVSATQLKGNQTLTVSVPITNNGKVPGKEVVQLYIRDVVGSTTRPVKELKNFDKVLIQPGETKTVTFTITPEDLKFYNYDLQFDWEAGDFDIMIGTNSAEVQTTRVNWIK
jgi:beta-glucosidase